MKGGKGRRKRKERRDGGRRRMIALLGVGGGGEGGEGVIEEAVRSFCGTLINLVVSMTPGRHDPGTSSIHTNDVGLTLM